MKREGGRGEVEREKKRKKKLLLVDSVVVRLAEVAGKREGEGIRKGVVVGGKKKRGRIV